jgi:hypothetical protein
MKEDELGVWSHKDATQTIPLGRNNAPPVEEYYMATRRTLN